MLNELDTEISNAEITAAIKQLKNGKSPGPDKYLNNYFIHGKDVLLPYLLVLFNTVLQTGHFLESWSEGYIIPLHKKGSIHCPEKYRGITLLSVLCKLFTRVLNNGLGSWAQNYNVYIEAQAGFRSGMSTVDFMEL